MKFEKLSEGKVSVVEKQISKKWGGVYDILNETIEHRKESPKFVFYDGPATANGFPGLHHMMAKFLKDSHGCIIFQEQIMAISTECGINANLVRGLLKKLGKANPKQTRIRRTVPGHILQL